MRRKKRSPGEHRDLAVRRLRHLTIGVAVTGAVASGALGFVAAQTFAGQSDAVDTNTGSLDQGATTDPGNGSTTDPTGGTTGATKVDPAGTGTGGDDQSGSTGDATPTPTFGSIVTPPTVTHHRAHISSGGSH